MVTRDHNDLTTLARGASIHAVGSVARALLLYARSYALARLLQYREVIALETQVD